MGMTTGGLLSLIVRKVLADLWINRTRTILVIASIAVGVFAVGAIMTTYVIFNADMSASYASAQPANIEVITDFFDDDLVKSVTVIPGVKTAEGRHMLSVRVSRDGITWKRLDIVANKDYMASDINLLTPIDGAVYPQDRELIVRQDPMNDTGLLVVPALWGGLAYSIFLFLSI